MFWDPYFGWDVYRIIRSMIFWAFILCLLASFISSTEGLGWSYPYESIYSDASTYRSCPYWIYYDVHWRVLLLEDTEW